MDAANFIWYRESVYQIGLSASWTTTVLNDRLYFYSSIGIILPI